MSSVGRNIPHDSARGHVTGESMYIDDYPLQSNELIVDFYWSKVAHGRIRSVDLEAARKVEGVVALLTAKDLPGENLFGPILKDEILLAEDVCTFIGQPIVVIGAESREAIKRAKDAIVVEIDELEPIFTIEKAIEKKSFIGETRVIRRGDADAVLARSPHVIEGIFTNGGQDHFYLESQAALAVPGENETMVIHSSTQNPSEVQEVIAHLLGLGLNQVVCLTKRMGGAFGGKECQATHPAAMAALVAHKTRRPARIAYNKDDDMIVTGGRHPFRNRYRIGFDDEGLITAMEVELFSDGGAFADLSPAVMARAMTHAENAYYIHDATIRGTVCRTNNAPNTAFRGFGGPQGVATMENIIEEVACYLKKDPFEVRRRNLYGTGDRNTTPYGEVVPNNTLPRILDELVVTSDYAKRRDEVRRFNEKSPTHLRGIALTPVKFGISFNTKFLNQANALVNIYLDGTVQVSTGATEMGQGVNTKIRQLVADELAIDVSNVIVMITSTEKNNNTSATAASSGADLNGSAAVDAARKLRQRLTEVAGLQLTASEPDLDSSSSDIVFEEGMIFDRRRPSRRMTFREVVKAAYMRRVSLGERGFYATPSVDWSWETGSGNPFLYYTQAAAVSEVEIDRFTGELVVLRSDLLLDIGRSINPGIDRGQIVGAFVQGLGWVTNEELRYTAKGELLTHSPTTYKIPNIQDLPQIFNVNWIDNVNPTNIGGSKAVGEPPLLLAISVWVAVKNALSFVSNGDLPRLHLPATGEEILMRLTEYSRKRLVSS